MSLSPSDIRSAVSEGSRFPVAVPGVAGAEAGGSLGPGVPPADSSSTYQKIASSFWGVDLPYSTLWSATGCSLVASSQLAQLASQQHVPIA